MITRSKARAIKKAQDEAKLRQATPTHAPPQQPSSRVDGIVQQARQPEQVLAGNHDQIQLQQAEMEAALLAAIAQIAAEQNSNVLAGAANNQRPVDGTLFEAATLEHLATVRARLDLMRTSSKIACQYLRVTIMVCQASAVAQQKLILTSSHLLPKALSSRLGACPDIVAIALLALLLHLFNVLCVSRVWTRESLAERVAASAAVFMIVGEFLETKLDWMFNLQFYATLVSMWGSTSG
jgi:hypothetical protein